MKRYYEVPSDNSPFSVMCSLSSAAVRPLEGLEELSARVADCSFTLMLVLLRASEVVVEDAAEVRADRLMDTTGDASTFSLLSSLDESCRKGRKGV